MYELYSFFSISITLKETQFPYIRIFKHYYYYLLLNGLEFKERIIML